MPPFGRCYDCFRPRDACFCEVIPRIENRTQVLILQHRRERFHPFNTARIVHKALLRSQLLVDHTANLAGRLRLQPGAGLLYPAAQARLLSDLSEEERPQQLVILDGTWHHAKALMRDLPALHSLPRFRLAPAARSRYRIRREPSDASLSTVEAIVAALRVLEPETVGLEQLLAAFETMVEAQLKHPGSANGSRFLQRRTRTVSRVPQALMGSLKRVIVAYGEATAGECGRKRISEPPVTWVARRLGDDATFSHTLIPPRPLDDGFLKHLELTQADFTNALSLDEARQRWQLFQRPQDVVTVFQPGTARLFSLLAGAAAPCLVLKSVDWEALAGRLPKDFLCAAPEGLATPNLGRTGKRLAETIAMVLRLHAVAAR
jgi:DTW domain-containing protein YfiP